MRHRRSVLASIGGITALSGCLFQPAGNGVYISNHTDINVEAKTVVYQKYTEDVILSETYTLTPSGEDSIKKLSGIFKSGPDYVVEVSALGNSAKDWFTKGGSTDLWFWISKDRIEASHAGH